MTLEERFWSKVDRSGGPNACWPWTGASDGRGYGRIRVNRESPRRFERPHRIAFRFAYGDPHEGHHIHHLCRNRLCVNARHLIALAPDEHMDTHAGQLALFDHHKAA